MKRSQNQIKTHRDQYHHIDLHAIAIVNIDAIIIDTIDAITVIHLVHLQIIHHAFLDQLVLNHIRDHRQDQVDRHVVVVVEVLHRVEVAVIQHHDLDHHLILHRHPDLDQDLIHVHLQDHQDLLIRIAVVAEVVRRDHLAHILVHVVHMIQDLHKHVKHTKVENKGVNQRINIIVKLIMVHKIIKNRIIIVN
jgi:hypothetical protein